MTFSRPQTQKIFSFFPQSVQFRDAGNLLGLWVFVFLCFWAWVFSGIRYWCIGRVLGVGFFLL
jgi:hypothetical protein